MLAGQVDPGHGVRGAGLGFEKRAQVGVGVQVAGERLDRGAPVVARVALLERRRLGDQHVAPEQQGHARPRQAVELDPLLERRERLDRPRPARRVPTACSSRGAPPGSRRASASRRSPVRVAS